MTPFPHPPPRLKARLRAGEAAGCHWLYLGTPVLADLAAEGEPDALVIDLQHGPWTRETLDTALGLIAARAPTLARLADSSYFSICQALDASCHVVIAPMVNSAAQAAAVVDAAHFPPSGSRSSGGPRVGPPPHPPATPPHLGAGVMIETPQGL